MEPPSLSPDTTPDLRFQLSLLRMISPGEAPTRQCEQVEDLLSQALTVG